MGHRVTYPNVPCGTTVRYSENARAVDGIPQFPGITKLRVAPAAIEGPPVLLLRVSTRRHGVTGWNRKAAGPDDAPTVKLRYISRRCVNSVSRLACDDTARTRAIDCDGARRRYSTNRRRGRSKSHRES